MAAIAAPPAPPKINVETLIEKARNDLLFFIKACWPGYKVGKHHRYICEQLTNIELKNIPAREMLSVPPRHGKTTIISIYLAAWVLGRNPKQEVMVLTFAADRARECGEAIRQIMQTDAFRAIFPDCVIEGTGKSGEAFKTTLGGKFKARGVEGQITGFGADWLIVDDPTKNKAEALSPTISKKLHSLFGPDLYTRLSPNAKLYILHTRWCNQDLIGWLHKNRSDVWNYTNIQAICTEEVKCPLGRIPGEALWPEQWPLERLYDIKAQLDISDEADFLALYQGITVDSQTDFFTKEEMQYYNFSILKNHKPRYRYASWDTASTVKERSDFTAGVVFELRPENLYVIDIIRDRFTFPQLKKVLKETRKKYAYDLDLIEHASAGISLIQELELDKSLKNKIISQPVKGDKYLKFGFAIETLRDFVRFSPDCPNLENMIDELENYFGEGHDDILDALRQGVNHFNNNKDLLFSKMKAPNVEYNDINKVIRRRRNTRINTYGGSSNRATFRANSSSGNPRRILGRSHR